MIRPDICYDKDVWFHHLNDFCMERLGTDAHHFQYDGVDTGLGGLLQDLFPLQNRGMTPAPDLRLVSIGKYQARFGTRGFRKNQHSEIFQASSNKPDHTGFSPRAGDTYAQRDLANSLCEKRAFNKQIDQENGNTYASD
jgi:hypothetical protein